MVVGVVDILVKGMMVSMWMLVVKVLCVVGFVVWVCNFN